MRTKTLFHILLLLMAGNAVMAQSNRFLPLFMLSYQRYSLKDAYKEEELACWLKGVGAGGELVLLQSNDVASLNLEGLAAGNFLLSTTEGRGAAVAGQVHAVAHLGAGSTPRNDSRVGIGAGAGISVCAFTYNNNVLPPVKKTFVTPTVMVEGFYKGKEFFPAGVRVNWSPSIREVTLDGWPNVRYFRNFGVSLVVQVPLGSNKH